jgi:hypothetical protein
MEHFKRTSIAHMIVLKMIKKTRDEMPLLGTRTAYFLLKLEFIQHGIKMKEINSSIYYGSWCAD